MVLVGGPVILVRSGCGNVSAVTAEVELMVFVVRLVERHGKNAVDGGRGVTGGSTGSGGGSVDGSGARRRLGSLTQVLLSSSAERVGCR